MPTEKSLISIANEQDKVVGTHVRGEPLPTGQYPMIAAVLLFNSKGYLIMQKIAAHKKWGGLWTYSAAGHVDAGETYRTAAQRELKEEMGVTATLEEEVAAFPVIREGRQIAFHHVFVAHSDAPITPDAGEVAQVREIPLNILKTELQQSPENFFDAFTVAIKKYLKI